MKRLFKHLPLRLRAAAALLAAAAAVCLPAQARWGEKVPNRQYADLKAWHLGFSVGTHTQDLNITHNGFVTPSGGEWQVEVPGFSPGICVNVLADLRLHDYFNLRFSPGMYFGSKTAKMLEYNSGQTLTQDIKSAYVAIPIDLKISGARLGNTRPYFTVGAMGTIDISKKRSEALMFKPFSPYLTVGLGCDFYLPFFKLIPEIKFCFGLGDILRHERPDLDEDPHTFEITQSLAKATSNLVVINFYFE